MWGTITWYSDLIAADWIIIFKDKQCGLASITTTKCVVLVAVLGHAYTFFVHFLILLIGIGFKEKDVI